MLWSIKYEETENDILISPPEAYLNRLSYEGHIRSGGMFRNDRYGTSWGNERTIFCVNSQLPAIGFYRVQNGSILGDEAYC